MIRFQFLLTEDFNFTGDFVTDDKGKPMVFYHGSDELKIKSFELRDASRRSGMLGQIYKTSTGAIFFAVDEAVAAMYGKDRAKLHGKKTSRVYKVHLKIKKPLDLRVITEENLKVLEEAGFDAWEKFGVLDNQGFMSWPDIWDWNKKHGYEKDDDTSDDPDFEHDYYYNIGNLNADASQFWAVADDVKAIANLKTLGYDGLLCLEDNGATSVAVFEPEQIEMVGV